MPDKYECETCGSDIRAGFVENENAVMEYGENPEYDMKACREHIDMYGRFCGSCVHMLDKDE
jgi:hypothetical protein